MKHTAMGEKLFKGLALLIKTGQTPINGAMTPSIITLRITIKLSIT
jgi:hypothetical protein